MAIRDDPPGQFSFVTLARRQTITVKGEPQRYGLVDIEYEGSIVAVFIRDVLTHCERVDAKGT